MYEIPNSREQTEYFALNGGLLETIPALNVPPGSLMDVLNYEPSVNGGYRRVSGYERFDGRTRPSAAGYTSLACTLTSVPSNGALITIGGQTCRFVKQVTGGCLVTIISGTLAASTSMTVGGTPVGTTANPTTLSSYVPTQQQEAENLNLAADAARSLIAAVPGSGYVRGVVMYAGTTYAWKNNAGGTACVMHKETASGWSEVTLAEEILFSNANANMAVGDTLTQGAVTAVIRKLVIITGTQASGVNTGKMVITGRAGGNFAGGAATDGGTGSVTLSGVQTAQAFPAGGKYEFDIYNFYGSTDTLYLYGATGVGNLFEFDGTYVTFINCGMTTPAHIKAHRGMLFSSMRSSVTNSSIGNPHRYVVSEGASETAVGATVTGMIIMQGESLGISTANSVKALVGTSAADWSLQTVSPDNGANEWTVQNLDSTYCLDDIGVTRVQPTDQYGNFAARAESSYIQPSIANYRNKAVCSMVSRTNILYRVFMTNNEVLVGLPGKKMSFTKTRLNVQAYCAWSGEDSSGNERLFIGAEDGYVYEIDRGSSFDGDDIESWMTLWFNHNRNPRVRKRYKEAAFECSSAIYSSISVRGNLTFDDGTVADTSTQSFTIPGSGGVWGGMVWSRTVGVFDSGIFDSGIFDISWRSGTTVAQPSVDMTGIGLNLSMYLYGKSQIDFGHSIQGVTLNFIPRR